MHLTLSLASVLYWVLAFLPAGRGIDGRIRVRLAHPALFLGGFALVLLIFRWPSFFDPYVYNLDEPQLIAQAMRYLQLPVPWRDVDGNTNGPITSWLLSAAIGLGAPATEFTSRFILWACVCGTVSALYFGLRQFLDEFGARLALLPAAIFFVFNSNEEFLHYSSETPPLLILCIALALLARAWNRPGSGSRPLYFSIGLLLGSLPLIKLQAGPPGLAAGLMAVYAALLGPDRRPRFDKPALTRCGWLIFGAVFSNVLILLPVVALGAGRDFWISYIEASRFYIGSGSPSESFIRLLRFETFENFSQLQITSIWVAVMGFMMNPVRPRGAVVTLLLAALMLLVTGVIAFVTPGTHYGHYLAFLIPGMVCLTAAGALQADAAIRRSEENRVFGFRVEPASVTVFFLLCVGASASAEHHVFFDPELQRARRVTIGTHDPVAEELKRITQPGGMMAIWGWMPQWYVASGLAPGTRDAVCPYTLRSGPYMKYFQERFLADMKASKPVVFVDAATHAACFYPLWPQDPRHEMDPALAKYVKENYVLHRAISPSPRFLPVRIYVRKDADKYAVSR